MNILHASFECYPVAKVGGLADVVGTLPSYQNTLEVNSTVIMPYYANGFDTEIFDIIFKGSVKLDTSIHEYIIYTTHINKTRILCCYVKGLLDTSKVYGYEYDLYRYLIFQLVVLDFILNNNDFDIIHCHDHHTALIPFLINNSYAYSSLNKISTVLTIHNAQYQGQFSHDFIKLLPEFDFTKVGLLDWYGNVNPLAAGIKCANAVTTVSPSYMSELINEANGLEGLLQTESYKCKGILNGIDVDFWNPSTDSMIFKNYKVSNVISGKKGNKKEVCAKYGLDISKPLFGFIGRLVGEKSADLLPEAIRTILSSNLNINFLVLGSGHESIENDLIALKNEFPHNFNTHIGYDEKLSHWVYAASDFLLMPSRVEPCGLNQMYSLRYGTIPIVRRTGGLKDTVIDIGDGGFGICHDKASVWDIEYSVNRALALYENKELYRKIQKEIMKIDHSWTKSAQEYINLYKSITTS